ncbi:hypothetical protein Ga0609869_003613 [Rhodovulum iodosum]|uniref:Sulfotransferase domain-containing protein n=1 Tax=Rhodovulum iodosum TaxID=68291 RepID=A0ABV3XY27_9RHOB|nr:sulfotransferase [Rhodovulum robiginosum]RSK38887.1 hypothetical protein EJA01_01690 [Rhodovulum robiginosum]
MADRTLERPLVIHVGLHKTGTTWLQGQLSGPRYQRDLAFCGDIGFIYRQFLVPDEQEFSPDRTRAAFCDWWAPKIEGRQAILVSGENLGGRPFHARHMREVTAARIAKTFPEAHILITLREQAAIIYSMYGQYLRFGYTSSLSEFLQRPPPDSSFQPVLNRAFYDYARLLNLYEEVFPRERVMVAPSEWFFADPDAFTERLNARLGTSLPPLRKQARDSVANPAWSDLAYGALRHLNRFNSQDSRWQRPGGRLGANAMAARIDRLTPAVLKRRMRAARMDMIRREIGDEYAASNRELAQRIGVDLGRFGYVV